MKKLYFLLVVLCIGNSALCQIINFPDANFKARLLAAQGGDGIAYNLNGNSFKLDMNDDGEIDVTEAQNVKMLVLYNCGISNLAGIEYFTNLMQLNCANNTITTLNLSALTQLTGFDAYNNTLTSLTVSGLTNLTNFSCSNNQLTTLNVSGLPMLHTIFCGHNSITAIDVSTVPSLLQLVCNNNLLTTLDVNTSSQLTNLNCSANNLTSLYIKNGSAEHMSLDFSNNPNLRYICADSMQLTQVEDKITQYGYTNCFVNTYCSFVPGGAFYTVTGQINYDETGNGYSTAAIAYPDMALSFSNGTATGDVYANETGGYRYTVQDGTHTITPLLSNPGYFIVSPGTATITLPAEDGSLARDFCVAPNGLHPDLNIAIAYNGGYASPGANNNYTVTYTNVGTNTQSGTVNFYYNDAIQDFVTASSPVTMQAVNTLQWEFTNLQPFEKRELQITLHLNSDNDTPAVYEGDLLTFSGSVVTPAVDETPSNNIFSLDQTVSYVELSTKPVALSGYFTLYPNPVSNSLNIKVNQSVTVQSVMIYNALGQAVYSATVSKNPDSIDVSQLQTGNYIIAIATNKGIVRKRFIKR